MSKSTFCFGCPDGHGKVEYTYGHFEDGKIVVDATTIEPDMAFRLFKDHGPVEFYKYGSQFNGQYEEFKVTPPKSDSNAMD